MGGVYVVIAQGFLGRKPKVWARMEKKWLKVVSRQKCLLEFISEYFKELAQAIFESLVLYFLGTQGGGV